MNPSAAAPIKLLIADDHPVVRDGLCSMFARDPEFEVLGEAADGAEAVRLAQALRPDVVLMDLRMPGMDGITAIQHLRAREDAKASLPVIVVTADAGSSIDEDCRAAGADDVLQKPVSMTSLFAAIASQLAQRDDDSIILT